MCGAPGIKALLITCLIDSLFAFAGKLTARIENGSLQRSLALMVALTEQCAHRINLVFQPQAADHVAAHAAVGDQQVDPPAQQLAEVGLMRGRRLTDEQRRLPEFRVVQVAG